MNLKQLPLANLRHYMGVSVGLMALVALLAFVALGGALVMASMQSGLSSLEDRLGADIIVAPKQAKSRSNLETVLLDGTPGFFYMDKSYYDKIASLEGVEKASPQYYLATVKAACCSMPVQVIGFDPETDFTVKPWIARSYAAELGREDVVTGANVSGAAGSTIMFYGVECRIVSRLDETGTALDNAVFATNETLQDLIAGSRRQGISVLADYDPDQVISTVQVKVADGYAVRDVADSINLNIRGVTAVQTKAMMTGTADSVAGMSGIVSVLMTVLMALCFLLLVVAFTVLGRQRTREFAVLRVIGASRKALSRIVVTEAAIVGAIGALVGCALALTVVVMFNGAIESAMGLPFLMPRISSIALYAIGVFAAALVAGFAASLFSASRLSKVDVGTSLREG